VGAARADVVRGSLCVHGDHRAKAVELELAWRQTLLSQRVIIFQKEHTAMFKMV